MDYEKKSSGVAKAGLATGITGTALGVLDLIKDQWGCKDGRRGGYDGGYPGGGYPGGYPYPGTYPAYPGVPYAPATPGCDCYVTKTEMNLIRENSALGDVNAKLSAELYTGKAITEALKPVWCELEEQERDICNLKAGLAMESERRACGDENLLTYVNGNFIKAEKCLNSREINYHAVKPVVNVNPEDTCRGFGERERDERRRDRDCDCGCGFRE